MKQAKSFFGKSNQIETLIRFIREFKFDFIEIKF